MEHVGSRPVGNKIHTVELTDRELSLVTAILGKTNPSVGVDILNEYDKLYNEFANICDENDIEYLGIIANVKLIKW